jgi:hypothetical protein
MVRAIPSGDNLFRSAVFPLSFRNKGRSFHAANFMRLYSDSPGLIEASVIWERYAPNLECVHAFGCRLAARMNNAGGAAGKPDAKRVYCGAYRFKARDVRTLFGNRQLPEIANANVCHAIEDGEIAHASLEIRLVDGVAGDAIEAVKTAIVDRLWHASLGPTRHACGVDWGLDPHPSNKLPDAPGGPYVDDRSRPRKLWDLVRFWTGRALGRLVLRRRQSYGGSK